jgi:hypothetical protein
MLNQDLNSRLREIIRVLFANRQPQNQRKQGIQQPVVTQEMPVYQERSVQEKQPNHMGISPMFIAKPEVQYLELPNISGTLSRGADSRGSSIEMSFEIIFSAN